MRISMMRQPPDITQYEAEIKETRRAKEEAIKNQEFQSLVFGSIDITEMIENLGHERIATEGKQVKHKKFAPNGDLLGMEEYDDYQDIIIYVSGLTPLL